MDGLMGLCGTLAMLLLAGGLIGVMDRERFNPRWLLVAVLLVAINDTLLTRFYGAMPKLLPALHWNWQGKTLALLATLAIAALPSFGWKRTGLTLAQAPEGLRAVLLVGLLYLAFIILIEVAFPEGQAGGEKAGGETIAFQLTLPGLEEEPFYRGILLFALDQAFMGRWRFLGVDWGWGAVLSCLLFGLAHAFSFSQGRFSMDALTMARTALPAFIIAWMRLRTGSVLLPILLHNLGNTIPLWI